MDICDLFLDVNLLSPVFHLNKYSILVLRLSRGDMWTPRAILFISLFEYQSMTIPSWHFNATILLLEFKDVACIVACWNTLITRPGLFLSPVCKVLSGAVPHWPNVLSIRIWDWRIGISNNCHRRRYYLAWTAIPAHITPIRLVSSVFCTPQS